MGHPKVLPTSATDMPLAIVGMGCLFPKADGLDAYWSNIKNAVDGIGPVPGSHWKPDDFFDADPKSPDRTYARRGGFLNPYPFNPAEFGIAPRDLEAIDTAQLLGLVVAKMAFDDAGLLAPNVDRSKIGVILGVTGTLELVVPLGARLGHPLWRKALREAGVADAVAERVVESISAGYVDWQENSFPGLLGNVVAGRIANRLDLGGTNCVVDAACASSLSAVHLAALELAAGRADAVLTGGVDTFNDIFMYMCFSKTPALSPTGDARPFAADADGTILGEGIGMFVLKRLADAEAAGDRIYAVLKGMGSSSDGRGNAVYAPVASGQQKALERAYERANISPATIDLVEGHGTGTKVGDAVELSALTEVYRAVRPAKSWCAIGSVKSQIGHTKAAAGAAGLIKAALALSKKVLPPTMKVSEPAASVAPGESPFYVNTEKRPWLPAKDHPRRAAVSSFGFGGSNFHCVLEEYSQTSVPDWSGDVQIAAFSAVDRPALLRQLDHAIAEARLKDDWAALRYLADQWRRSFDPTHAERLVMVLRRGESDPSQRLTIARERLDSAQQIEINDGYFGTGPAAKSGALFPGQGAQYVGMLRDLACQFPEFQLVLAEADRAFAAELASGHDSRLSDFIYPPRAFSENDRAKQDGALRDTSVAQPALGAIGVAALRVLERFGVKHDAAAGHSYGELTALCAARCIDSSSLFALSQLRGRLMANQANGDAGAMLAVMASIETIESTITNQHIDVVFANRNGPAQTVLSGTTAEIDRAAQAFTDRKVRHVRLPVSAAFHSPLVAKAAEPFRAALEPLEFHAAHMPVFANSTAQEYPRDPNMARDLLANQLARPVDFMGQIRNMYESGVRTFLEIGPGQTLTKLVGSILADQPHHAIALDASLGRASGELDLAHVLAQLAALGHRIKLDAWDPAPPAPPERAKAGLRVPICGANYVRPKPQARPVAVGQKRPDTAVAPADPPKLPRPMADQPKSTPANVDLQAALRVTQESLAAFQRLQEQTADVHRLFLEQQSQAQQTLQVLLAGQQQIISGRLASPMEIPAAVAPPPRASAAPVVACPAPPRVEPSPVPVQKAVPVPAANGQVAQKPATMPAPAPASPIIDILLAVVSEKTGYPIEMLDLDMGLDADLGIDSIKRVEILSAMQERLPHMPAVPADRLGSLHTLRQVVELIDVQSSQATPDYTTGVVSEGAVTLDQLTQTMLDVVAEKTGYPVEMLDLDMGLDADLGIDSIKRVEILSALQERFPETPTVPADRLGSLHTLRQVMEVLQPADEKKNTRARLLI